MNLLPPPRLPVIMISLHQEQKDYTTVVVQVSRLIGGSRKEEPFTRTQILMR
jgi:hypothetical protein